MNAAPATTVQAAPAARRPRDRRASSQATMPPTSTTRADPPDGKAPAGPIASAAGGRGACTSAAMPSCRYFSTGTVASSSSGSASRRYRAKPMPATAETRPVAAELPIPVNPLNAVVAQPARWETNQSYSGRSTPATAPLLASRPSIHITSTSRVTPTIRTSADAASAPGGPAAPSRSRSHPAPGQGVLTPFLSSEVVRNVRNHSPRPPRGSLWRGRIWDYVVARVTIDYRGALALADGAAVVRCRLQRIGRSSLTTREQVLAPDGRVAAEAEVVIVAWDATTGGSRPLEQVERAALERELEHVGA